jgi:sugar-specific transcriptional regulator TrmB
MEILEEIGLSTGEATVYTTLLSIGETKVGKIIEQSRMASSAVHNGLNSLTEKGLVTHILKGKIRSYRAVPPETLLAFHDEKRARLEAAIPVLAAKNPTNPPCRSRSLRREQRDHRYDE